ncbi:WLM-domain-containing protein [Plenodomus tracheiphilus IPT5]|uniref:WLM-domain-containing protein n=1 Tax=Plenodomus tracheiphilus IPT5 TaxID=1408161 RepID=A0A6A7B977_9PLEO|nr:WLM-domain-containing protein [Plenodomus tracheiphilus IPT5]
MPLGFERLNERTQRPNTHVNFIRTLPGPTSPTALSILNGVAAICYPLMKSHTILVQALEEYPHNREFVGRNFNAGEVIQLVLRDARGRWLPQRMVEMVMVHELAHCKQMNHSKAFWKVRNGLAGELRALWGKGYTGEGLWGRGRDLESGGVQAQEGEVMDVPEHLCGGTYGRRRGKRRRGKEKDKEKVSYAERKQRRILKKFGAGGEVLGADDEEKVKLEGVVPKKGKPKVAGSARGRELRAAAALARFETWRLKGEEVAIKKEETSCDSETEDEFIEGDQHHAAVEVDGKFMFDDKGRALIKICEDEDDNDGDARREMDEIQGLASPTKPAKSPTTSTSSALKQPSHPKPIPVVKTEPSDCSAYPGLSCPICSLTNPTTALTCNACTHVLQPDFVPDHWRCRSMVCKASAYVNAGDTGRCGVCAGLRAEM